MHEKRSLNPINHSQDFNEASEWKNPSRLSIAWAEKQRLSFGMIPCLNVAFGKRTFRWWIMFILENFPLVQRSVYVRCCSRLSMEMCYLPIAMSIKEEKSCQCLDVIYTFSLESLDNRSLETWTCELFSTARFSEIYRIEKRKLWIRDKCSSSKRIKKWSEKFRWKNRERGEIIQ